MFETPEVPQRREQPHDSTKENETPPPRRYKVERIPEAPLIERKIHVARRTPIFPTRNALIGYLAARKQKPGVRPEDHQGEVLARVPTVLRVIGEDGRTDAFRVANSNGEAVGWLQVGAETAYEWSTNQVYRPRSSSARPVFFSSENDPLRGKGRPFPEELWDDDIVFPLLEAKKGEAVYRIGHPLPRTVETNVEFPLWVRESRKREDAVDLLVDKRVIEATIHGLQHVENQWAKLKNDPDARKGKRAQQLLDTHKGCLLTFVSGNASLPPAGSKRSQNYLIQETADFLGESSALELDFLRNISIDNIIIMTNEDFSDFLLELKADIKLLRESLRDSKTYSMFHDKSIVHRVVSPVP